MWKIKNFIIKGRILLNKISLECKAPEILGDFRLNLILGFE